MSLVAQLGGATVLLVATAAVTGGGDPTVEAANAWLHLVDKYGTATVFLFYMVVKDWYTIKAATKRELHHEKRYKEQNDYIRTILMTHLSKAATALESCRIELKKHRRSTSGEHRAATDDDSSAILHTPEGPRETWRGFDSDGKQSGLDLG